MISDAKKTIDYLPKKIKKRSIGNIKMETRLSSIIPLLLIQVSLRFKSRPPKKINAIKKTVEEAIQLLKSTLLRLSRKTKPKIRNI